MIPRRAVGQQSADLIERPVDADHFNHVGVFGGDFESSDELRWEVRAAHFREAAYLLERKHGHDPRHNGHRNPRGAAFLDESIISGVIEKKLSRDKRGAGIDFAAEVSEVEIEGKSFRVFFGITRDTQTEIIVP